MCREGGDDRLGEVNSDRLSKQQLQAARKKAAAFQQRLVSAAQGQSRQAQAQGAFFAALFHLAAEAIEGDVNQFCEKADEIFEEIEAHGKEPALDNDWLMEVTGEKDNFYFSTENLVSDLATMPRRKRRKKELSEEERERLRQQVKAAIIDDDTPHQSFEQALATAHGEDPQMWIEAIQNALETTQGKATFWALHEYTGLSAGELLLGLLLGQDNWIFRQDRFYGQISIEEEGFRRETKRE